MIHDQIEFDQAVKVAIDFAEKDKETLVIITTDHGNANPGIIYGKYVNENFDSIQKYTQTNQWIIKEIKPESSISKIKEIIEKGNGHSVSGADAKIVLEYYGGFHKEEGIYNYKKLPFKAFAEMQGKNKFCWLDHYGRFCGLCGTGHVWAGKRTFKIFCKKHRLTLFNAPGGRS